MYFQYLLGAAIHMTKVVCINWGSSISLPLLEGAHIFQTMTFDTELKAGAVVLTSLC